jgi:outer membrane protein OmpA-like peptidoglycan-associated protein
VNGLYIGAGAGANWVNPPSHVDVTGSSAGKVNFHAGWTGLASLGWGFGNGLRVEVEGNYRDNGVDSIRGFGLAPVGRTGGFQRTYGVMGNVFYDIDPGLLGVRTSYIQPYIGAGVGYAWTNWRNVRGVSTSAGLALNVDDTQGAFAFQGIAGVAAPLSWAGVPGLSLTMEYRFMGALQPELSATLVNTTTRATTRTTIETQNYNHSVMVGLRYAFNHSPPPAPPAPMPVAAPIPARTYLIFFDWDRADLTSRAREIIAEAAENSRRVQVTRIEVQGHADRSGSDAYNLRLSRRRADAVSAELVARGVPRGIITIQAFGESRPLVPTADGVREPQNRRVEIILR